MEVAGFLSGNAAFAGDSGDAVAARDDAPGWVR